MSSNDVEDPEVKSQCPFPIDAVCNQVAELSARVERESRARTLELAGQEHRLIPALVGWLKCFLLLRPFDRELFVACSQALVWCLVPSAATASISIVSVIGLLIALQANRVMWLQTARMEEQNMLAEAQRRASLVIEATSLFEQIEHEKELAASGGTPPRTLCESQSDDRCWREELFVPSAATMGRLAALTQALRPYRYLVVDQSLREDCGADNAPPAPTLVADALFQQLLSQSKLTLDAAATRAAIESALTDLEPPPVQKSWQRAFGWVSERLVPQSQGAQLSCQAVSPERGQLLASLHAARIDLSALATRGATFQLADLPDNIDLTGIELIGVNLSGARMRGAKFHRARLAWVNFEGADLGGASFQTACLESNNFGGAELHRLGQRSIRKVQLTDAPPLFFLPTRLSFNDQFDSAWVRYTDAGGNGFGTVCSTLNTLESRVSKDSESVEVAEQALVLERLRQHWLIEVTGAQAGANGAGLLRPDVVDSVLAGRQLGAPGLVVQRGAMTVRMYALQNCPVLIPQKPDPEGDRLLGQTLAECSKTLAHGDPSMPPLPQAKGTTPVRDD